MGDGTGGHVVQRPRQTALPHRHGDVRQRRGNRRRRHPRLLSAGLHSLPHFLEEGSGSIINDMGHDRRKSKERNQTEKERKMSKQKKNVKKRNRNQGKIQRYIYRK